MDADERNTRDAAAATAAASLAHPYVWTSCVFLAESPHRRAPWRPISTIYHPVSDRRRNHLPIRLRPPMLLPHLGGLFPVWNDSNRREPNEPVHSLTTPRLGVIAPGPGLTTFDALRRVFALPSTVNFPPGRTRRCSRSRRDGSLVIPRWVVLHLG